MNEEIPIRDEWEIVSQSGFNRPKSWTIWSIQVFRRWERVYYVGMALTQITTYAAAAARPDWTGTGTVGSRSVVLGLGLGLAGWLGDYMGLNPNSLIFVQPISLQVMG
jgi:hypothetical protein